MTLFAMKPTAGVIKDDTELMAEGYYTDADKIRFRLVQFAKGLQLALPQIIGGWEQATQDTFDGKCRALLGWQDLEGRRIAAVGTNTKCYAATAARLYDITPVRDDSATSGVKSGNLSVTSGDETVTVTHTDHGLSSNDMVHLRNATAVGGISLGRAGTLGSDPVRTATLSDLVLIEHTDHGLTSGDFVTFAGSSAVNGVPAGEINTTHRVYVLSSKLFQVQVSTAATASGVGGGASITYVYFDRFLASYVDDNTYTVEAESAASSTTTGGGTQNWKFEIPIGLTNTTLSAGYGTGQYSSGTYSLPSGQSDLRARVWHFSRYGENLIGNYAESPLYRWQNNSAQSMAALAATDAPQRSLSNMVLPERFAVALGTEDAATSTFDPMQLAWATQEGGFTTGDWTPAATNTAGDYRLGIGTRIVRGMPMPLVSLVWTDIALYAMQYLQDTTFVFGFPLLGTECGLIGPNAAVRAGDAGSVFWLAPTWQFFRWDGGQPQVMPCPVREYMRSAFAPVQEDLIYAAHNPAWNEVGWFYPTRAGNNECAAYVIYNYVEGWWSIGTFDITAWHPNGDGGFPIAAHDDGTLHLHERGDTDNGDAITWFFETGYFDIDDGDRLMLVKCFVPDVKDMVGGADLTVTTKLWPHATEKAVDAGSFTNQTKRLTFLASGRQIKVKVSGTSAPAGGRFGALRFDVKQKKARR